VLRRLLGDKRLEFIKKPYGFGNDRDSLYVDFGCCFDLDEKSIPSDRFFAVPRHIATSYDPPLIGLATRLFIPMVIAGPKLFFPSISGVEFCDRDYFDGGFSNGPLKTCTLAQNN
jgi:hypothetical protein